MLRQRIKKLLLCFTFSCAFMAGAYYLSVARAADPNGFIRKLPSLKVVGTGFVKLPGKNWYFSGTDTAHVYLSNQVQRDQLLSIGIDRKDTVRYRVSSTENFKITTGAYLKTAHNNIYLVDGMGSQVAYGPLKNFQLDKKEITPRFVGFEPLWPSDYILKSGNLKKQSILVRLRNGKVLAQYELDRQGDGVFSTDGILTLSPDRSRIFYTFYYRNLFLCLDTNLKVLYRGKTIDTVAHAKLKLGRINSLHQLTLAAPPQFVTKHTITNDKYLFVNSALKADNEIDGQLKANSPIDIYWLTDGKYQFSFYITDFAGEKMRDFRVIGNKLFVLFDHYLYRYQLNF